MNESGTESPSLSRLRLTVRGQVQGVGFRPYVYGLAHELTLTGFVGNTPEGVIIEVQGPEPHIRLFRQALPERLPPLARITNLLDSDVPIVPDEDVFRIQASLAGKGHRVLISPDVALCPDCRLDMLGPDNRRYLYPFTNCTNCGPRYSITAGIPYDRSTTSMACFRMCPDCLQEYQDPLDRRFHAQPNCCPVCGPRVWLSFEGGPFAKADATGPEAIIRCADLLAKGGILALKGLGGFHIACDATRDDSVERLRRLKERPHKPFAVMVADLETASSLASITQASSELLTSPAHPVVLCPNRPGSPLSGLISPDTALVGLFLPYTPLHEALFQAYSHTGSFPALVMTSGNSGGTPICLGNREAVKALGGMVDAFLLHDRDILVRVDDSVVSVQPDGQLMYYRRARGFVPRPLPLGPLFQAVGENRPTRPDLEHGPTGIQGSDAGPSVLGVGAELKNTLCLTKGPDAFVSQHIGDLGNVETACFHSQMAGHFERLLEVSPDLLVRDLHPDFLSSRFAEESGLPVAVLQHHFAHGWSVLAEHQFLPEAGYPPVLVLALDGTGLGQDGSLWGGEALYLYPLAAGGPEQRRVGHLSPFALPGGDAAVREPWRIAHAFLLEENLPTASAPWLPRFAATAGLIRQMMAGRLNTPMTSSCGRLFDLVAAMTGLCLETSYEGQAAVRLEDALYPRDPARQSPGQTMEDIFPGDCLAYPMSVIESEPCLQLDIRPLCRAVWTDHQRGVRPGEISRRFHAGLAQGLSRMAVLLAGRFKVGHVGLSGGCLQNRALAWLLCRSLREQGLIPLTHRELPPNDGCISLGQAAFGKLLLRQGASPATFARSGRL